LFCFFFGWEKWSRIGSVLGNDKTTNSETYLNKDKNLRTTECNVQAHSRATVHGNYTLKAGAVQVNFPKKTKKRWELLGMH
jgi:hypothetical protein